MKKDIQGIARQFDFAGQFSGAEPMGLGHINDTWCVTTTEGGRAHRYTLQRINTQVFRAPAALMENAKRVTDHMRSKLNGEEDAARHALVLVPTRLGAAWLEDETGDHWRAYRFIEGAQSVDVVESEDQAFQAARAFGRFQRLLADFPMPRLHETIPDFHNTPKRFEAFERVLELDPIGRVSLSSDEVQFALDRKGEVNRLLEAGLPERVTHNDTKINNVLLDVTTGKGLSVIDLDTVMPGLAPYDFGDLVRTVVSPAVEDEQDLSKVMCRMPMYEALLRGYLEETGQLLTQAERALLPFAGRLITFETGLRFLTDYLSGDSYFKTHREHHNLDRCRTQFRLVEAIEAQMDEMQRLGDRLKTGITARGRTNSSPAAEVASPSR